MLSLALLLAHMCFSPIYHCVHLTWGQENCMLIVHLFVYCVCVTLCLVSLCLGNMIDCSL